MLINYPFERYNVPIETAKCLLRGNDDVGEFTQR